MQPAAGSEDIHKILNRFSTWTGKGSPNGHHAPIATEGVREVPYDEALRQIRSRRGTQGRKTAEAASPDATAATRPVQSVPVASPAAAPSSAPVSPTPAATPVRAATPATQIPKPAATLAPAAASPQKRAVKKSLSAQPELPSKKLAARPGAKKVSVRPEAPRAATKAAAAPAISLPETTLKFRQVLARALPPSKKPAPRKASGPERSLRITIRFSPEEEQQIQLKAAALGLTVSAYLRRRALGTDQSATAGPRDVAANLSPALQRGTGTKQSSTPDTPLWTRLRHALWPQRVRLEA